MAGAACKIIANGLTRTVSESLEKILTSPLVRDKMLDSAKCDELLNELVEIDLLCFVDGFVNPDQCNPPRNLLDIVNDLVDAGVITDHIWLILAKPQ